MKRFIQGRLIFSPQVVRQALRAAPQVPDAHRACISVSVHLSEGLNLHGAGKGNQHVGNDIEVSWHESYNAKKYNFNQQYELSPVNAFAVFVSVFDLLC